MEDFDPGWDADAIERDDSGKESAELSLRVTFAIYNPSWRPHFSSLVLVSLPIK